MSENKKLSRRQKRIQLIAIIMSAVMLFGGVATGIILFVANH